MTWIDVCSLHLQRDCFGRGCAAQNAERTGDYRNSMDGG